MAEVAKVIEVSMSKGVSVETEAGIAPRHLYGSMILCAAVLHLWWAVCVAISPEALKSTPINVFLALSSSRSVLSLLFLTAAVLAVLGFYDRNIKRAIVALSLQQVIMLITMTGALRAMWHEQYADLVLRSFWFISPDQISVVLLGVFHSIAYFEIRYWKR